MPYDYSNRERDGTGAISSEKRPKVEFTPPDDLKLDGMSGEALVSWEMKDGKVCITSMNGTPLAGYREDEDDGAGTSPTIDDD